MKKEKLKQITGNVNAPNIRFNVSDELLNVIRAGASFEVSFNFGGRKSGKKLYIISLRQFTNIDSGERHQNTDQLSSPSHRENKLN